MEVLNGIISLGDGFLAKVGLIIAGITALHSGWNKFNNALKNGTGEPNEALIPITPVNTLVATRKS